MRRRAVLSTCLALSTAAIAPLHAQPAPAPRRYAVLSLIGDRLTIVGYVPKVGSTHDTNEHQVVPVNDTAFDTDALRAAEEGLRDGDPGAPVSLLFAPSRKQYENQQDLFDGKKALLQEDVLGPVRATGSTHLVLLSKLRAQANFQYAGGTRTGSGWIDGIGFYIDRITRTVLTQTGQQGVGYLVPYVYATASLIDLSTKEVVGAERVMASRLISAARSEDAANPWEALTPKQKIDALRTLIRKDVGEAVATLVKANR